MDAECHCIIGAFSRVTLVDRGIEECDVHGTKAQTAAEWALTRFPEGAEL